MVKHFGDINSSLQIDEFCLVLELHWGGLLHHCGYHLYFNVESQKFHALIFNRFNWGCFTNTSVIDSLI